MIQVYPYSSYAFRKTYILIFKWNRNLFIQSHNQHTNWQLFREIFTHTTSASTSLKTNEEIEAATEYLNTSIINAIRLSTPAKTSISKHEASNSNTEILQRFRSKTLRSLIDAPWYVTNEAIHRDLKIPTVKDEVYKSRSRYNTRISNHHNPLVTQLLDTTDQIRRLKRKYSLD